jgi:hypothetical protein
MPATILFPAPDFLTPSILAIPIAILHRLHGTLIKRGVQIERCGRSLRRMYDRRCPDRHSGNRPEYNHG